MIEIEELDEDADEKACISCKYRHFNGKHNECTVDGHYIGYLALWLQTCKHHSLEEKRYYMSKSYSWWCGRKKRIKKKYTLLCGSYISPKELKDFYRRHKPVAQRRNSHGDT